MKEKFVAPYQPLKIKIIKRIGERSFPPDTIAEKVIISRSRRSGTREVSAVVIMRQRFTVEDSLAQLTPRANKSRVGRRRTPS